jgi:hypothetical protein
MLQTLRIWRTLISLDMGEWPWREPWDLLESWKFSYNHWGGKHFLKRRVENFLNNFEWYIPTKRTRRHRRECRRTYLESYIFLLEGTIQHLEEQKEAYERKNERNSQGHHPYEN